MEYIKRVHERIAYLKGIQKKALRYLDTAPPGKLRIKRKKGIDRYYVRESEGDTNGRYLPRTEKGLINMLAQKEYFEKLLKSVNGELKALELFISSLSTHVEGFDKVYESVSSIAQEQVPPLLLPDRYYAEWWQNQKYEAKRYFEGEKKQDTNRGDKVRSKFEAMIANILFSEGIPYRYECPIILGGHKIFPDFTLLDVRNNRELYWEHFGMIDDPIYAANAVKRISAYTVANGMAAGNGLIVTAEASDMPFSIESIREMVRGLGIRAS